MANSAQVGLLRVLLTADTAEFQAAMRAAAGSAQAWTKDLKSIGNQAQAIGSALTKTLSLPILAIGGASLQAAIQFESSFAGVKKTVNATDAEFAQMAQGFRDLAKTIPINVNELNKIGEAAGQLGIGKKDILEFSSVMAQLGVTTNLTSDAAATAIAQIQNIFNASGNDTKNFASALVALGNAGASTESQIVDFASRLAGAGHQIGLSQQTVLGFSSALANMGLNAELGGTAMSKTMSLMSVAVDTGGKKLEAFARVTKKSSEDFKTLFKADAGEAILQFVEGLGKASQSGENLTIILRDLGLKGSNVQDVLKRLAGGVGQMREAVELSKKSWTENTALTIEAQKRFETTSAQLTLLGNRFRDVGITIGNALLPMVKAIVSGFNVLLPVIETVAKMFAALPVSLQIIVTAFALLVAAAGPAVFILGQLATSAAAVTAAFTTKGVAARAAAGELGGLQGAASLTGTALGLLGKAAGAAGAAFVGWEIGRVIANLLGLDKQIEDTITGINNLKKARELAAGGKSAEAEVEVQAKLADLERQRVVALASLNFTQAALLKVQIEALKNDTTRLAIQDTINKAIHAGAAANVTYADAIQYNSNIEAVRLGTLDKSVDAQKRSIASLLALGKITQQQANDQLAALAMVKKVNEVKERSLSLNEFLANSEENIKTTIAATGYSVAQLVARLKDPGFAEWAKLVGLDAAAIHYLESQLKTTTKATYEALKASEKYARLMEEVRQSAEQLTVQQKMQARTLDALGFSTSKIADVLGVTDEQVKRYNDSLKASAHAIAEIGKQIAHLPRNVPLHLQGQSFAGAVPMVDVAAVQAASQTSGAIKQIADATWGDIEGRMRAAGVFTKVVLAQMAADAKRDYEEMKASGLFTYDELAAAAKRSADAQRAAQSGVGARLGRSLKGALLDELSGFANDLSSVIAGNMSIGKAFGNYATNVAKDFTRSALAMIPGIGPILSQFAGPIIDGLKRMFASIFHIGTAGRDEVQKFADSKGGFDALHQQLATLGKEGEQLWINLTQGVGRNNPEEAKRVIQAIHDAFADPAAGSQAGASAAGYKTRAELQDIADKAKQTYDYMRTSGIYTASAVAEAFQKSKDAQIAAMGETSTAAFQSYQDLQSQLAAWDKELLDSSTTQERADAIMAVYHDTRIKMLEAESVATGKVSQSYRDLQSQLADYDRELLDPSTTQKRADEIMSVYHDTRMKMLEAEQEYYLAMGQAAVTAGKMTQERFDKAANAIKALGSEIKGLSDSIAGEAPEEFMGVVERQTRDRIESLAAQRQKLEKELEQQQTETQDAVGDTAAGVDVVTDAAGHTLDMFHQWKNAINDVGDALRRLPRMPGSGEVPEPATGLAQGGVVRYLASGGSTWQPRGTDTVPAMLTLGEGVVTRAGMSSLGVAGLTDINSGRWLDGLKSDLYSRVPAFEPTAGGGTPNLSIHVDASGAYFGDTSHVDELATKIAKAVNRGGSVRTAWSREVTNMVQGR